MRTTSMINSANKFKFLSDVDACFQKLQSFVHFLARNEQKFIDQSSNTIMFISPALNFSSLVTLSIAKYVSKLNDVHRDS
jgi:hypothetical protein